MSDQAITNFILETIKDTEIENVVVIYKTADGETSGQGNIQGIKDMHACLKMLESYTETLRASIPTLN